MRRACIRGRVVLCELRGKSLNNLALVLIEVFFFLIFGSKSMFKFKKNDIK